jgi:hypothetical protein
MSERLLDNSMRLDTAGLIDNQKLILSVCLFCMFVYLYVCLLCMFVCRRTKRRDLGMSEHSLDNSMR